MLLWIFVMVNILGNTHKCTCNKYPLLQLQLFWGMLPGTMRQQGCPKNVLQNDFTYFPIFVYLFLKQIWNALFLWLTLHVLICIWKFKYADYTFYWCAYSIFSFSSLNSQIVNCFGEKYLPNEYASDFKPGNLIIHKLKADYKVQHLQSLGHSKATWVYLCLCLLSHHNSYHFNNFPNNGV